MDDKNEKNTPYLDHLRANLDHFRAYLSHFKSKNLSNHVLNCIIFTVLKPIYRTVFTEPR